ncbi:hypothetical protein QUA44_24590 [Microcoleus sp. N9_A2]
MLNFTCLLKVNFNSLTFEWPSEKLTSQPTSIRTSTILLIALKGESTSGKKLEVPSLRLLA